MDQRCHQISLDEMEHQKLVRLRDNAPKAYMRERATAILKIADGIPAAHVAQRRLLRARQEDILYEWLDRYEQEGIAGLVIRPSRERKPAFPPAYDEDAQAQEALLHVVRRDPRAMCVDRTRNSGVRTKALRLSATI